MSTPEQCKAYRAAKKAAKAGLDMPVHRDGVDADRILGDDPKAPALALAGDKITKANNLRPKGKKDAVNPKVAAEVAEIKREYQEGIERRRRERKQRTAAKKATKKPKVVKAPKAAKPVKTPGVPSARGGAKSELLISMLKRKKGATKQELADAAGWVDNTIRGWLSTQSRALGILSHPRAAAVGSPYVRTYYLNS